MESLFLNLVNNAIASLPPSGVAVGNAVEVALGVDVKIGVGVSVRGGIDAEGVNVATNIGLLLVSDAVGEGA